jgi:uncharacterized membrane protein YccC
LLTHTKKYELVQHFNHQPERFDFQKVLDEVAAGQKAAEEEAAEKEAAEKEQTDKEVTP